MTTINNKLGSVFGSAGVVAGIAMAAIGATVLPSLTGFFIVILGLGFSVTYIGTSIDIEKNEVFQYNAIFGIFKIGEKQNLDRFSGIMILPNNESYTIYSKGNRSMEYSGSRFKICLVDETNLTEVILKKSNKLENAQIELKNISKALNIRVIENEFTNEK